MDQVQEKVAILQDSLRTLTLEPSNAGVTFSAHNVLLGKVLSTRSLRRYTITEIISKTWSLKARVSVEKLEENIFKFSFRFKEDKETIFRN